MVTGIFSLFYVNFIPIILAGISTALGQGAILFINKVKLHRFVFNIFFSSLVFCVSYLILYVSIFLISLLIFNITLDPFLLLNVLALAYLPLSLNFLIATPYFGQSIGYILSIWSFYLLFMGFSAEFRIQNWLALQIILLGWLFSQALQRTFGQPLSIAGNRLNKAIFGSELIKDWKKLDLNKLDNEFYPKPSAPINHNFQTRSLVKRLKSILWLLLIFSIISFLVFLSQLPFFLLIPASEPLGFYLLQSIWIPLSIVFFLLLSAPLEPLAWWAGWYGEHADIFPNLKEKKTASINKIHAYVIFLGGVGQVDYQYKPKTEFFLRSLKKSLGPKYRLIKGIIPYVAMNKPLTKDRFLAFLWRFASKYKFSGKKDFIGWIINLRNILIVVVSGDRRYSKIYSRSSGYSIKKTLLNSGYTPFSNIPIVLIGQSGGGQIALSVADYLKKSLGAKLSIISMSGFLTGNIGLDSVDKLYHLVGTKDLIEKMSIPLFPGRWRFNFFSQWNKAKKHDKIELIRLPEITHTGKNSMISEEHSADTNRSNREMTVELISKIIKKLY